MKRFICLILLFILFSVLTINSFAYEIDGTEKRTEWENSSSILLLDREESNNKINFGSVNWAIEDGSLFLCFNFIEKNISDDTSLIGVSLIVEDSEEFIVTVETSPAESDSSKYYFEGAVSFDYTKGATCEIRVGAKYGLPSEILLRTRFIDSNGSYSNVYDFTIQNREYIYENYEPDEYTEPQKNTTTKNIQTTKPVTEKTTKAEKTTKKSSSKTTKKSDSGLFDFIFKDKEETTSKTAKADKTTKKSSEKTKKSTTKNNKTTTVTNNVQSELISQTNAVSQNSISAINSQISTTEGSKYKLITAIFGGITLVTVAILGTIGANKKANKKNNKDD